MASPFMYLLDKVLAEHTPPDGVEAVPADMWARDRYRDFKMGDGSMSQEVVVRLNLEPYAGVLTLTHHGRTDLSMQQVRTLRELLDYVATVGDAFHDVARDELQHRKEREAERQAEAEQRRAEYRKAEQERREAAIKERERRNAALDDRKATLMNELVEEEGRIRLRGRKRWRPVTVQVEEWSGDNYRPYFEYRYKNKHGVRQAVDTNVQAFHVKLGSKFYNVWDDGTDDLRYPEHDGADVRKKKVAGDYTSGLTADGLAEDLS